MRLNFITVSRTPERVRSLELSLDAALGSAPSLHASLDVIDGRRLDLFRGYNAGAARAHGEILVFLHDDVRLLGNSLTFKEPLVLLEQPETGLLGVAGATYIGRCGCWWEAPSRSRRGAVAQKRDGEFGMEWSVWPKRAGRFGPVVVLDGLFLMCRREVFERLGGFDQATYTGFHFYDLDITFRATLAGLVNYAAPLPLLHGSRGNTDEAWGAGGGCTRHAYFSTACAGLKKR